MSDGRPLPSYDVVIPCFDRAHVMADAVESALMQSVPARRIILVDDGSGDATSVVAGRLAAAHDRVVALLAPRNGGAAMARNIGIAASRADWIAFLDSDDVWIEGAVEAMLAAGVRDALDVVVGQFARVGRDGAMGGPECGWDGRDIRAALATGGVVGPSWSIVRGERVRAVRGFDPSFRTCEDWDFFVRLAASGARFGRIDRLVALYRAVGGDRLIDDDDDLAIGRRRVLAHPFIADLLREAA